MKMNLEERTQIEELQYQYMDACGKRKKHGNEIYLTPTLTLYYCDYQGHGINQAYDHLWFDDEVYKK